MTILKRGRPPKGAVRTEIGKEIRRLMRTPPLAAVGRRTITEEFKEKALRAADAVDTTAMALGQMWVLKRSFAWRAAENVYRDLTGHGWEHEQA